VCLAAYNAKRTIASSRYTPHLASATSVVSRKKGMASTPAPLQHIGADKDWAFCDTIVVFTIVAEYPRSHSIFPPYDFLSVALLFAHNPWPKTDGFFTK
jgi:hypothetical protein